MGLDPRVKALMWLSKRMGRSFRADVSVATMRAAYVQMNRRFGVRVKTGVTVQNLSIPASDGATIGARFYRPDGAAEEALPVLLFFHGGGFVIGDVASYDGLARFIASEGRFAVISVDYRLGPEYRFPRAYEDAFSAFEWLQKSARDLGLSAEHVAVGGDSAGGGLAAALASYATSRGLERPGFAFLIYPSVDGTGRFPSRSRPEGNLPLTPATVAWFGAHFRDPSAEETIPYLVPLDAPQPERHPPAYLLAAQFDPLVDEGRAYYERLRDAGVAVTYDLRATLPHGFVNLAGILPEARKALRAGIAATARALGVRRVAALTGAGSGIGRALAVELAQRGYALALADRNAAGLEATAQLVRSQTMVTTHVVDVAERARVDTFAADVLREHHRVDLLINNAGVAIAGSVAELAVEEIAWLMNVNFWGTVYGVKAFLPALLRASDATIVNLSSVYGLFGPPGQSAYAASKFAVRGFSESLREELRGSGVHVVTVHPGGIKTNIARNARVAAAADRELAARSGREFERRMLTQTPEKAAHAIVRGIERRRERVLIGADARRVDVLTRVLGPCGSKLLGTQLTRHISDSRRREKVVAE